MMQLKLMSTFLMGAVGMFVLMSCSGANQKALDRNSAEKLLRQHMGEVFQDDLVMRINMNDGIFREGFSRYGNPAMWDASLQFWKVLTDAGYVLNKGEEQDGANTLLHFKPVPQEGEKVMMPGTNNEFISLSLATRNLVRITGITQDQNIALAEIEISYVPTKIWKKLLPKVAALVAKCPAFRQYPPSYCLSWPTQERFLTVETSKAQFIKYDDGWRVKTGL